VQLDYIIRCCIGGDNAITRACANACYDADLLFVDSAKLFSVVRVQEYEIGSLVEV
jgi:hypothetical protein